jgi:predicted transcriptional regulator
MKLSQESIKRIISKKDLKTSEKLLFLYFNTILDNNDEIKLQNREICDKLNMAINTISKAFVNLENKGMISRNYNINDNVNGHIERIIKVNTV